eukprot:TRINITY_DN42607_c0_g1_i1.p1 TRINITY_DN42607_c0_g1~~TRINITY_DN42607_c0_g1_i1.p1  ORF type:complete len:200 (+),score=8.38 TRINITY_DN42607_c0_g1_i1:164-763(+)
MKTNSNTNQINFYLQLKIYYYYKELGDQSKLLPTKKGGKAPKCLKIKNELKKSFHSALASSQASIQSLYTSTASISELITVLQFALQLLQFTSPIFAFVSISQVTVLILLQKGQLKILSNFGFSLFSTGQADFLFPIFLQHQQQPQQFQLYADQGDKLRALNITMWAGVPSEPLCLHTQSLATAHKKRGKSPQMSKNQK